MSEQSKFDGSARGRRSDPLERVISSMPGSHLVALLTSKPFEVVYIGPYRGGGDEIVRSLNQCDNLINGIAKADLSDSLILAIGAIDACLIKNLNGSEIRTLATTILNHDARLLQHAPVTRSILAHTFRAVECCKLTDPSIIRRITRDLKEYREKYGDGD